MFLLGKSSKASHFRVTVVATNKLTATGTAKNFGIGQVADVAFSTLGVGGLSLELVSSELNPGLSAEAQRVKGYAKMSMPELLGPRDEVKYNATLDVHENVGEIGAILVTNELLNEMYLDDIVVDGLPQGPLTFNCESWIQSKEKRIFFTNRSYLPSQTPTNLVALREEDLESLRGNGKGERKAHERIYDYDAYNDLGDPDKNLELKRPVLGNNEHPYPRRCRTGRALSKKDPLSETRVWGLLPILYAYVPRDESFVDTKQGSFLINGLDNMLNALPSQVAPDKNQGFSKFKEILTLYTEGLKLAYMKNTGNVFERFADLVKTIGVLSFPTTDLMERDEFSWFRDEEFARQTLAGLNPFSIKLVTEWPIRSKLDPKIYGPQESAITSQLIEQQIKGYMSIDEALEQKKLFMLDYHDLLLPYVNKVRKIEGTTLYGSRTLFFLTNHGTLRPLAIELTRPPTDDGKPQWKQVFTHSGDHATETWLWRIAKAHVLAHDSGYHQLISHWLRTHCCTEPYIIATNRQLSAMHPIYRLLKPYFRFTMNINALARQYLINADGIIERNFSTGKYSMEISSAIYDQEWRFDHEALPADLISRGMAIKDPSSPHGLKLTIEDYPFAKDGLQLWDAINQWVNDYVTHFYPDNQLIESDPELQAWWTDIRTKGHPDKKDEPWWPDLRTPGDLVGILTTIIWVSSGHHAAVNFGQYTFAGYFPNRPTIARIKMPSEDPTPEEWKKFIEDPHGVLLDTFPSKAQATLIMGVLNILSTHSPDEEYIGDQIEASWKDDPKIKEAFENFNAKLKKLDADIDARNGDPKLKNRNGAGTLPYQLLKPFSEPGVTGMGVPNSISI